MTYRHAFSALRWIALAMLVTAGTAAAAGPDDFVRTTGQRTFESLGVKELTDEERAVRFRQILDESFDVRGIARFTLGHYWRTATTQQQNEYVKLFEDFIVLAYANRFKDLSGHQFQVMGAKPVNESDTLVESQLIVANNPPVRVLWRVHSDSASHRIRDVVVEGISMSVTQRDEFAAVIRTNGGKVDGLISALKKKTGQE